MFELREVVLSEGALQLQPITEAQLAPLVQLAVEQGQELAYMADADQPGWYASALADQQAARALVFAIFEAGELVGTTRFADINATIPACEIGWTWLRQERHGTGLNQRIKFLMLSHAFEQWGMRRVQLKTAAHNLRSQRAITGLGAVREGVLRNHRRLANGAIDDTVMFSITDQEWPAVRAALLARLNP